MSYAYGRYRVSSYLSFRHDELNAMGMRAAAGDRQAEAQAIAAIGPLVRSIVTKVVGNIARLVERRDDLEQEGFAAATAAIRRYDGRAFLIPYLRRRVSGHVRTEARAFFSRLGASTPKRDALDLSRSVFLDYIACGDHCGMAMAAAPDHSDGAAHLRSVRHRIMQWLRRLTPAEKDIVLRRWGVPPERASRNRWAALRAHHSRRESLAEIGEEYGVSGETIRQIQARALVKLGIQDIPDRVQRV